MARTSVGGNLRQRVAIEAARIMVEQGIDDYLVAKKKAAQRLGLSERAALPANAEVERALLEHRRLFSTGESQAALTHLRTVALAIMRLLEQFRPRLVGAVLSGAITDVSAVELHVFCDSPEVIAMTLMDREIEYHVTERRVRYRAEDYRLIPVLCFEHEGIAVEAYVFSLDGERQSPLCPVNGKPMRRVGDSGVSALLNDASATPLIGQFLS